MNRSDPESRVHIDIIFLYKYTVENLWMRSHNILPGIAGFIQKLRHLGCFSTSCLSTDDDAGIFSDGLHDDLLLCQHGQLQSSLLQQQAKIYRAQAAV